MKQNKEILARLAFKNVISQSQIDVLEEKINTFQGGIEKYLLLPTLFFTFLFL